MESVIIKNLEILKNDIGCMPWEEAKIACSMLGEGWRLPTIDEFKNIIYKNRDKIGGFEKYSYWSSSELTSDFVWNQGFTTGKRDYNFSKKGNLYVRPVKSIVS